ncbi:MAG: hypothetical protein AAF547_15685 [Actinomycetota bacterium]
MTGIGPAEEPWEAEIGDLLAGLPQVAPPAGFIDQALDHRPLRAGRTMVGLAIASVVAVGAVLVTGAAGRTTVTPQIDELAQRHTTVQAGVLAPSTAEVDYRIDTPVDMPDGFERTRNLEAEEVLQAVYARGDTAVSVFVQDGPVGWNALAEDGLTTIDGRRAWVDEARRAVVVEASGSTVVIVGLSSSEVGEVLATVPEADRTIGDRVGELVEAVTGQLGFPGRS